MRVLLFAGKGGSGTTTVAAAAAAAAARSGVKTLVLAPDRTRSLTDLLDVGGPPGVPQEVAPSFFALTADPAAQLARTWPAARRRLGQLADGVGAHPADLTDALTAAGGEPVLSLLALAEQVRHGPWDLVVVDAGTGPAALRLLTVADDLLRVADRVWSPERRLGLLRPDLLRGRPHPLVSRAVTRLRAELVEVRSVLRAPTTSVRLVLSPDRAALAHARRAMTALIVQGYAVDGVVANRVLTDDVTTDDVRTDVLADCVVTDGARADDVMTDGLTDHAGWPRALVEAQRGLLADAEESFAPTPVHRVPYLVAEPAAATLAALGDRVLGAASGGRGDVDRLLAAAVLPEPAVRRCGDRFELVLPVPFLTAADVDLVRDGDELHLTVPGTHRAIALPSVLRRCVVTAASVAEGRLVVRFEPDPSLWPYPSPGEGAADDKGAADEPGVVR